MSAVRCVVHSPTSPAQQSGNTPGGVAATAQRSADVTGEAAIVGVGCTAADVPCFGNGKTITKTTTTTVTKTGEEQKKTIVTTWHEDCLTPEPRQPHHPTPVHPNTTPPLTPTHVNPLHPCSKRTCINEHETSAGNQLLDGGEWQANAPSWWSGHGSCRQPGISSRSSAFAASNLLFGAGPIAERANGPDRCSAANGTIGEPMMWEPNEDDAAYISTYGTGEEEELFLPRSVINKLIKEAAGGFRVSSESRDVIIACCHEFVRKLSSKANTNCEKQHKKLIGPDHVLAALADMGMTAYKNGCLEVMTAAQQEAANKRKRMAFRNDCGGQNAEELLREQQELFARAREQHCSVLTPYTMEDLIKVQQKLDSSSTALLIGRPQVLDDDEDYDKD